MSMQKYLTTITEQQKKVMDQTIKKNDIIFDIDWQGIDQLSKFKNLNYKNLFDTPNKEELKQRLTKEIKMIRSRKKIQSIRQ